MTGKKFFWGETGKPKASNPRYETKGTNIIRKRGVLPNARSKSKGEPKGDRGGTHQPVKKNETTQGGNIETVEGKKKKRRGQTAGRNGGNSVRP